MYDELVKQLRFCAATDVSESPYPCDGCSYDNPNDYGLGNASNVLGCSARMMLQAADAIDELLHIHQLDLSEIVRLRRKIQALQEGGEAHA